MNSLIRRDGFVPTRDALFSPFQQIFDKFYEDFWNEPIINVKSKSTFPKWDIYSDDENWIVEIGLSGVKPEDVKVEIIPTNGSYKNMLKISGRMSEEHNVNEAKWIVRELRRSNFERCVYLPNDLKGEPNAVMKNGVLKLTWKLPKERPPNITSKTIEIKEE